MQHMARWTFWAVRGMAIRSDGGVDGNGMQAASPQWAGTSQLAFAAPWKKGHGRWKWFWAELVPKMEQK